MPIDLAKAVGGGGGRIARKRQLFIANGTFSRPANMVGNTVWVSLIGGGGGGDRSTTRNELSQAAYGGDYLQNIPVDIGTASSVPVTVGAGGVGRSSVVVPGSGSPSSFGGYLSVSGGAPASMDGSLSPPVSTGAPGGRLYANGGSPAGATYGGPDRAYPGRTNGPYGCGPVVGAWVGVYLNPSAGSGLMFDGLYGTPTKDSSGWPSGIGYGAGGHSTYGSVGGPGSGKPGAVLVEWDEEA